MLTSNPNIVVTRAPPRSKRRKPTVVRRDMPTIVAPKPAPEREPDYSRADAADRLFRELVTRALAKSEPRKR